MLNKPLARRVSLVILTLLPVILIWSGAEFYLHNHAHQEQLNEVRQKLVNIRSRLEQNLYSNLLILNSLAAVVKTNPDIDQQAFQELASHLNLADVDQPVAIDAGDRLRSRCARQLPGAAGQGDFQGRFTGVEKRRVAEKDGALRAAAIDAPHGDLQAVIECVDAGFLEQFVSVHHR